MLVVFRALLFGGLKESRPECSEVELKDTNALAFEVLLRYIYTGRIRLLDLKVCGLSLCALYSTTGQGILEYSTNILYIVWITISCNLLDIMESRHSLKRRVNVAILKNSRFTGVSLGGEYINMVHCHSLEIVAGLCHVE